MNDLDGDGLPAVLHLCRDYRHFRQQVGWCLSLWRHNFLNLNAGWIHRLDSGHIARPWKGPTFLIGLNTVLASVNALFLGAGAKVWGYSNALWAGLIFAALIIPVFMYRHYAQDGGRFPPNALEELGLSGGDLGQREAGMWPYVTLIAGAIVVLWANWFFVLPG